MTMKTTGAPKKLKTLALLLSILGIVALLATVIAAGGALTAGAVPGETDAANPIESVPADPGDPVDSANPVTAAPISSDLEPITPREGGAAPVADAHGITPFSSLMYKIFPDNGKYIGIVGGILHPDTQLPAKIEVAVPEGSPVFWFGEILGGDPSLDPTLPQTDKRTENGLDIYTATITQAHEMQIEYYMFGNPFTQDGNKGSVKLAYTPAQDVGQFEFAALLPAGAVPLDSDLVHMGTDPQTNQASYARSMGAVKAGEEVSTVINYSLAQGGAQSSTNTIVIVLIVALIVLCAGLVFFLLAKRMKH